MIQLTIRDYSLWCHLGCSPEEREPQQEVRISLSLGFAQLPHACKSDQLSDTICYAEICRQMNLLVKEKHFQTVEHLSFAIREQLAQYLKTENTWRLTLHKVKPPIDGLLGGVTFEIDNQALHL